MEDYNTFIENIKNKDEETMYRNFVNVLNEEKFIEEVDKDYQEFIEDVNDDRRRISIGIFKHIPSGTLFKATTRINNDPCGNFNVMDFSIGRVSKKEKTVTVYE